MTHAMKKQDHTGTGKPRGETMEESHVVAWLRDNPHFFNRHPDLLPAAITASGKVLSLEAGQLDRLRGQNEQLRENLDGMVARIRRNEEIFRHFHVAQVGMISARTPADLLWEVTESSERQFNVFRITVAINERESGLRTLLAPLAERDDSRVVLIGEEELLDIFGRSDDPVIRIGREGRSRQTLFADSARSVRSEALIPLYSAVSDDHEEAPRLIGSLNLGGNTLNRFLPSDSTDLLRDMAHIFALCLLRFLKGPALKNN